MTKEDLAVYSAFIQGQNSIPKDPTGGWTLTSPAHIDHEVARFVFAYSQIDQAIDAGQKAQEAWAAKSLLERKAILEKTLQKLIQKKERLFEVAQNELGRSVQDLNQEWKVIQDWVQAFQAFHPETTPQMRVPRGISAVLSSYVWPLFYSIQDSMMNLLAGNAVILKPSEKSTLTVLSWVREIKMDAEVSGLLQVLVGEKELGRRLACHEQVNTVLFRGSFEAGIRVRQDTLSQPAKETLLFLGAKNPVVVCDDASPDVTQALIQDSFLSTGQHCRSASVVFVHGSRFNAFLESFHEKAKSFKIGAPMSRAYAGPLIDESMLDRYLKFAGISEREGGEIVMRGKPLMLPEKGFFVTPTIAAFESLTPEQMKKSVSLQTEILSPHVSFVRYESYEACLEVIHQMNYGLCAAVWGENLDRVKNIGSQLRFGNVLLNQSLLDWNPAQSFQGQKKSGNHAYHGFQLFEQLTLLKA